MRVPEKDGARPGAVRRFQGSGLAVIAVNDMPGDRRHQGAMLLPRLLLFGLAALFAATPAAANAGLPMLAVVLPELLLLLIPTIVIEAQILISWLGLRHGRAFAMSTLANLASTLVGVPLTWMLLRQIEIVTLGDELVPIDSLWDAVVVGVLQAPWVPDSGRLTVMVVTLAWLMLVFFAISCLFEWAVIRGWLWRARTASAFGITWDGHAILRPVVVGNAISYSVAFLALCVVVLPSIAF